MNFPSIFAAWANALATSRASLSMTTPRVQTVTSVTLPIYTYLLQEILISLADLFFLDPMLRKTLPLLTMVSFHLLSLPEQNIFHVLQVTAHGLSGCRTIAASNRR